MQSQSGTHVYQISSDCFICGVCQFSCTDVISLLAHKAEHSIHSTELIHKCELCKDVFSTTGILKGHYYDAHKITMCFTKPISTQSELPKIYSEEIEERHAVNYTIENVGQNNDGFDSAYTTTDTKVLINVNDINKNSSHIKVVNVELITDEVPPNHQLNAPMVTNIQHFEVKFPSNSQNRITESGICLENKNVVEQELQSNISTQDQYIIIENGYNRDNTGSIEVKEYEGGNSQNINNSPMDIVKPLISPFKKHPFILVTKSEKDKVASLTYLEFSEMIMENRECSVCFICIYCALNMNSREILMCHLAEKHCGQKDKDPGDFTQSIMDDIVRRSGLICDEDTELKYIKRIMTIEEYDILFDAFERKNKGNTQEKTNQKVEIEIEKSFSKSDENEEKLVSDTSRKNVNKNINEKDKPVKIKDNLLQDNCNNEADFLFLLVTESCSAIENLYLKTWMVCLHCYRSMCSRDPFIKHIKEHKHIITAANYQSDDNDTELKNTILEHTGLLNGKSSDIKFVNTIMSMSQYDQLIPFVKSASNTSKENINIDEIEKVPKNNNCKKGSTKTTGNIQGRRLEKQDLVGSFPCEKCKKVFNRLRYLRRHVKLHTEAEVETYVCTECGKEYLRKESLRSHRQTHLTENKFQCQTCDFISNDRKAIFVHRQIHPAGSTVCHICGNAYGDRSTLSRHMVVHDQSRPYICKLEGCTWRFKSDVMMNAHYQSHVTPQGKFVCLYCGKSFRRKHHLQRHQVKIHGTAAPKPKPYGNQYLNEDLVEIPSEQLEINEATFIDQPIFVTLGTQEEPIVYETCNMSSINTLMQSNLIEIEQEIESSEPVEEAVT